MAGNIPEIGAVANGANALISLARGNNTQAAMYAGAAALSVFVPGGQAIAESGELAVDAVEEEQAAQDVEGVTEEIADASTQPSGGVYALQSDDGAIMRTGRTNDLARRAAEHARDPNLNSFTFVRLYRTDDYAEQRGLEQMVHDLYHPPLNKINPIGVKNPRFEIYMQAAKDFKNRSGQ